MSTRSVFRQVDDPASILASGAAGARLTGRGRWLLAGGLAGVIVAASALLRLGSGDGAPRFRTEEVTRGTLTVTVSATGKLQPTNQVDVGAELSGIVDKVYVDDNDRVSKGQVLARLELSRLEDAVARSRANLASAEAQVLQAQATTGEARANLARLAQVAELSGGKVPSQGEMDAAKASLERAEANQASASAAVRLARASLRTEETNQAKAHIRSPFDGVVLARKVEPGQTVAAAFQAPVLFTLAEDLATMELQVDVDEADVSQVRASQPATFSVDAWPGRRYEAVVTRVGFGSQVKEGVVSYLTLLQVDNRDLSLRPGMTGTAEVTTAERDDVLLVPNAALRFTPPVSVSGAKPSESIVSSLTPRPPGVGSSGSATRSADGGARRVWVVRKGPPVAIPITVGASDGRFTEVTGGDLQPGMRVITDSAGEQR